ncbi:UNVERIFIED_CONTAM: hypothetical protein GTU68_007701 [Idotea baltica]|nr:hypothetical protein [Idotea baltica]
MASSNLIRFTRLYTYVKPSFLSSTIPKCVAANNYYRSICMKAVNSENVLRPLSKPNFFKRSYAEKDKLTVAEIESRVLNVCRSYDK